MYGVVVMMALSTGAETPDLGKRNSCHGCCGGYSSCYGGYSTSYGCSGSRVWHSGCCGGGVIYRSSGFYPDGYHRTYGSADVYYDRPVLGTGLTMPGAEGTFTRISNYPADTTAATITVRLAEPGTLMIDDYQVATVSDRHTYITSSIPANETRKVTSKTYVNRGGARELVTREATVKPGQRLDVDFRTPAGKNPPK